jgi:hypothetical protein
MRRTESITPGGWPTKPWLVRSISADDVIDYTREDFADGRQHYDLILDIGGEQPALPPPAGTHPTGTAGLSHRDRVDEPGRGVQPLGRLWG